MTAPLWCLVVVAFLPYACAWTGAYFRQRQFGAIDNRNPRQQQARLEGGGARIVAAQANAWEALPFFTAAVLVSHVAGADPTRAALLAKIFVASRILHPIFYVADLAVLRSIVFLVGFAAAIGLFVISA
ncbi:MAG: MAPEG family protein [Candidatus Binatia bacterium]